MAYYNCSSGNGGTGNIPQQLIEKLETLGNNQCYFFEFASTTGNSESKVNFGDTKQVNGNYISFVAVIDISKTTANRLRLVYGSTDYLSIITINENGVMQSQWSDSIATSGLRYIIVSKAAPSNYQSLAFRVDVVN